MDSASLPLLDPPHDAAAFERLYRATAAHVHTLARRLLGPADADDATQDVYVRAWHKRDNYRGEGDVRGWLHRLALHALLNRRRDRARRAAAIPPSDPRTASRSDTSGLAATQRVDSDARLDLQAALERLPAGARRAVVLHDVEGLRHEDIAALLGISIGTSKSQLHRARALLRRALRSAEKDP